MRPPESSILRKGLGSGFCRTLSVENSKQPKTKPHNHMNKPRLLIVSLVVLTSAASYFACRFWREGDKLRAKVSFLEEQDRRHSFHDYCRYIREQREKWVNGDFKARDLVALCRESSFIGAACVIGNDYSAAYGKMTKLWNQAMFLWVNEIAIPQEARMKINSGFEAAEPFMQYGR